MSATEAYSLYSWKDKTSEFKNACAQLNIGELVKEPSFGLFEAMSAIEMMDPKMDAGMTQNQTQSKIKSIKAGIENNLLKTENFGLEEKLAIVDNTLRNLVTWLDGSSLAQTLFTNLYLHDPNIVQDFYIKNFSIAILKIADHMRNKIITSASFEEEDFQPLSYNFKFAEEIADSTVLNNLKSAEDSSAKFYRHLKGEVKGEEKQKNEVEMAYGLWYRMRFIRSFFFLMSSNDEYQAFANNSEEITKHINICLESLTKVKETHELGSQPEMIKVGKTIYPTVMGFEPTINQHLLPPTFPRFIQIHSFAAAYEYFQVLLTKLSELIKVSKMKTFDEIYNFGLDFSEIQSIFLRSMLQLVTLPRSMIEKVMVMKKILLDSVLKFISPPILNPKCPVNNKEVCLQLVDSFLVKCTPAFVSLFQILGHNKPRQREKIAHVFEEFASFQDEADNLDSILHSFFVQQKLSLVHYGCFGSWILDHNLTLMSQFLISGFELQLFAKYECHYIYWYLCEIIVNWQMSTLSRVDNFLLTNEINFLPKNAKKPKKRKSVFEKESLLKTADRHMFSAFYQAFRAFLIEGLVKSPNPDFDCEEFRYNHRLGPFQFFTSPAVCLYNQFKDKDEYFIKAYELDKIYGFARDHFDMARGIYEKYPECANQAKIAKNNFVVMRLLSSGLKKLEKIELDFSEIAYFPMMRL